MAGQGQEDLVQARLPEREVGDGDGGMGQGRKRVHSPLAGRRAIGVEAGRERDRIGVELHGRGERAFQHVRGGGALRGIEQADA